MVTVMRTAVVVALLIVLVAGARSLPAAQPNQASQTIATYCAGRHNGVMRSLSGTLLDQLDPAGFPDNPDAWSRAYRELQAGTMPPVGAQRPEIIARVVPASQDG